MFQAEQFSIAIVNDSHIKCTLCVNCCKSTFIMWTQNLMLVFFFLGSSQLRHYLVETQDMVEHGADYNENYQVNYDYDYKEKKGK